jgi:Nucleotidyl transferase AbiEii toxin, Type IV TA system
MNRNDADRWKSEVLDEIFAALAADNQIQECLVFKGARVLNARLGGGRQSLDLDSNLMKEFVERHPNREEQGRYLEHHLKRAIYRHFERHDPVRFELKGLTVKTYPPNSHPMGWDAFKVKVHVDDLNKAGVKGLPRIDIDVAAPEELLATSISPVIIGNDQAFAYTLERIAGEKMRAFLSSLPAHRAKSTKPGELVRAKDLYDLARIHRIRPIEESGFWDTVGQEFRIACRSRYIDCLGLETFTEQWQVTAETYTKDPTIPSDINIAEARSILEIIVGYMKVKGIIPFEHQLPNSVELTPIAS